MYIYKIDHPASFQSNLPQGIYYHESGLPSPSGVGCNSPQHCSYITNFMGHWPANWQPVLTAATAIFYAAKSYGWPPVKVSKYEVLENSHQNIKGFNSVLLEQSREQDTRQSSLDFFFLGLHSILLIDNQGLCHLCFPEPLSMRQHFQCFRYSTGERNSYSSLTVFFFLQ